MDLVTSFTQFAVKHLRATNFCEALIQKSQLGGDGSYLLWRAGSVSASLSDVLPSLVAAEDVAEARPIPGKVCLKEAYSSSVGFCEVLLRETHASVHLLVPWRGGAQRSNSGRDFIDAQKAGNLPVAKHWGRLL